MAETTMAIEGVIVQSGGAAYISESARSVPTCANCVPGLFSALWGAHKAGDDVQRTEAQERIVATREALILGDKNWIAGLMYGLKALGIGGEALCGLLRKSAMKRREKLKL